MVAWCWNCGNSKPALTSVEMLRRKRVANDQDDVPVAYKESHAVKSAQFHATVNLTSCTYWLTRILLLRYIAFIYCKYFGGAGSHSMQLSITATAILICGAPHHMCPKPM